MNLPAAVSVGVLAGAHAATWGMYKDSVHEGFAWSKYARSVMLGAVIAGAVSLAFGAELRDASGVVLLFGLTYAAERGAVEVYKTFLRVEDQTKYVIPMQLHVGGALVRGRWDRALAGMAYVGAIATIIAGIAAFDRIEPAALPRVVAVLVVGSIGGWLAAVGGAWKDAPIEGFDPLKFLRSPIVATCCAVLLASLTDRYLFISVAALGYERALVETYKTFLCGGQPPGKFAGKPILFPHMLRRRRYFVPLYAAIWMVVMLAFAGAMWQRIGVALPDERVTTRSP